MKIMQYCVAVSVLASALSISVFAGNIHTGVMPEPTPTPTSESMEGQIEIGVAGDMHTGSSEEVSAEVVLAEAVLRLVQGALSLL